MLRGTCYRDMSETDPDFPEQFRTDLPSRDNENSLQLMDSFDSNSEVQGSDPDQPMSVDPPLDWAEEMQRDSAEKSNGKFVNLKLLPTLWCGRLVWWQGCQCFTLKATVRIPTTAECSKKMKYPYSTVRSTYPSL